MCFEGSKTEFTAGKIHQTRDGSLVLVEFSSGEHSAVHCMVLTSANPETPAGHKFKWKNQMGHVRCAGNDGDHQSECDLHPLDSESAVDTLRASLSDKIKANADKRLRRDQQWLRDEAAAVCRARKAEAELVTVRVKEGGPRTYEVPAEFLTRTPPIPTLHEIAEANGVPLEMVGAGCR